MTNPGPALQAQAKGSSEQRTVLEFHRNDDVDGNPDAHHHTVGNTRNQASPGNHIHDGVTSQPLLSGVTFTGTRGTIAGLGSIVNQICNALESIGATNSTVP